MITNCWFPNEAFKNSLNAFSYSSAERKCTSTDFEHCFIYCLYGHIVGSDSVRFAHLCGVNTHSSCIMCMYDISTYSCVCTCAVVSLQRVPPTNEAAFTQRSSGWRLNDNEYMWGVGDYITTEMEMQKKPRLLGCVSAWHFAAAWFCLHAIKLAMPPRVPAWQKESGKWQMTRALLALLLWLFFFSFKHIKMFDFYPVSNSVVYVVWKQHHFSSEDSL